MTVLKHANQDNDLLVLVCREAKIITMIFNVHMNSFEVLSLHSFENEKGIQGVEIIADPESRCVVGKISGNKLFVIPTRLQDRYSKDEVYMHGVMGYDIYKPLFTIEVPIYAKSMALIKGYTEPTLAILHSPHPLQYPMSIKFYSINLKRKDCKLIKTTIGLSPDCHSLIALNPPLSGILAISSTSVYYIGDNIEKEHSVPYFLYNCVCEFVDPYKLLILICTGEFIMLGLNYVLENDVQVLNEKNDTVETIMLIDFPCMVFAYEAKIRYFSPYLFVGSRIHDSFLLNLQESKIRKDFESSIPSEDPEVPAKKVNYTYTMVSFFADKCDELIGICGALSAAVYTRERSDGQLANELLVTSGFGKNSYISKISLSLQPMQYESFTEESFEGVSDITGLFSVKGRVFDLYIVISKSQSTQVLKIEENIDEVTDSTDFLNTVETLSAGRLGKSMIYQCYIDGIRILSDSARLIRDVPKPGIWKISVIDKNVSILYLDGTIENCVFKKNGEEVLYRITGQATSISLCKFNKAYVLAVGREDGRLEMYYMLTNTMVLCSKQATEGPAVITSEDTLDVPITDPCQKVPGLHQTEVPYIIDLLITTYNDLMLLCIMVSTGQVLLYKSFDKFKFSRIVSPLYLGPVDITNTDRKYFFVLNQGILVNHKGNSFWVVVNSIRNMVYVHSTVRKNSNSGEKKIEEEEILCACSFNHPECLNGFIYRQGSILEIGKFEESIEAGMKNELIMVRKRVLETPRHILIHAPYIIVSFFVDTRSVMYHLKVFIYSEAVGFSEVSSVQQFTENEVIMAMCICKFSRKLHPPFEYLVIGTGMIGTEDTTSQGRLILFAFNEGKLVYQTLHKKPGLKGCVSALGCMQGYLLVGVGAEFKLFSFVDEEEQEWLEPIAFYYGYTMSTGLDIQESTVLCTDTLNQMYLLEYEEANSQKNLKLKGQYFRELFPLAVSFHMNRQIVADKFRNIHIFLCHSNSDKIEKVGDLHTGLTVYSFCNFGDVLLMISQEGAISAIFLSNEGVYKKVHTLQNAMLEVLPNRGGLNSRGYRLSSTQERERQRKSVLDLTYVLNFCYLSAPLQRLISRNIGTIPHNVFTELSDLNQLFN